MECFLNIFIHSSQHNVFTPKIFMKKVRGNVQKTRERTFVSKYEKIRKTGLNIPLNVFMR